VIVQFNAPSERRIASTFLMECSHRDVMPAAELAADFLERAAYVRDGATARPSICGRVPWAWGDRTFEDAGLASSH